MKKIILFGGAFDPPHKGHLQMAQVATDHINPDLLLWIPTNHPSHRENAQASFEQRCEMIQLLLPTQACWQLSTIEKDHREKSYFIDTFKRLLAEYGPAEFYVLIGQDQLAHFTQWQQWQDIVNQAQLLVMPREGQSISSLPNAEFQFLEADKVNASSTQIKQDFDSLAADQLPNAIQAYTTKNGLY